jgi:hypothetical protein
MVINNAAYQRAAREWLSARVCGDDMESTNDGIDAARRLIAEDRDKKTGFLDLGNLQRTELPVELFELTHLQSLNLVVGSGRTR